MTERMLEENFEQIEAPFDRSLFSNLTHTSIELGRIAMEFARSLELDLQLGLLSQFAIVHDLVELKTNDIATLLLSDIELHEKETIEAAALQQLLQALPPYIAHLLERYERQDEPEARFVRFVDKLLPIVVDILGEGQRVLQEDYNIHLSEELVNAHSSVHKRLDAKFGKEFPAISTIHSKLSQIAEHFIKLH